MATHSFKVGGFVEVFNQTLTGRVISEGVAEVRELCLNDDDVYLVRFPKDRGLYRRHVAPREA